MAAPFPTLKIDLIAEIEVPSLAEFNSVVTAVRSMDGVAKSETHLFLGPA